MGEPRVVIHSAAAMDAGLGEPEVERKLPLFERLYASATLRKTVLIIVLAIAWEIYARFLDNPLLFPTLSDTIAAVIERTRDGIPYARPEVVLLFKAKAARPKDDGDLAAVLPHLELERRRWLAEALELIHPGHRWFAHLA